jgi:hypothetical protein
MVVWTVVDQVGYYFRGSDFCCFAAALFTKQATWGHFERQ